MRMRNWHTVTHVRKKHRGTSARPGDYRVTVPTGKGTFRPEWTPDRLRPLLALRDQPPVPPAGRKDELDL